MIDAIKIPVTTVGAAGVASASATTIVDMPGRVIAVHLSYDSAAPATTDVKLSMVNTPNELIISKDNNATASWIYPRKPVHDNTGAAIVGAPPDDYVCAGQLALSVAQCDAIASAVIATVYMER